MAKANYERFQARISPEDKKIIDGMLKHMDINQAEFVTRYFPALFMAVDEEKYMELYKDAYAAPEELDKDNLKKKQAE
jgi:hypothetical protein